MPASNYVEQANLACWLEGKVPTPPTHVFVGLAEKPLTKAMTAAEVEAVECNYPGYERVEVPLTGWTQTAGSGESVASKARNIAAVLFPKATKVENRDKAAYVFFADAKTGGHLLYFSKLAEEETVTLTSELSFAAEKLEVADE